MQNNTISKGVQNQNGVKKKLNGTQQDLKVDKRNFFQVALIDLQNFIYFFAPLVFMHNAAW